MRDRPAIRQLMSDRVTAMRTGDAETTCRVYAPDAVVFSLAPPLVRPPHGTRNVAQM